MAIQLMDGRSFTASDNSDAPLVAIVNQTFAKRYYRGAGAIGGQLDAGGNPKRLFQIVGVVADTRTEALSAQADPEVHVSFWQNGAFSKHLVLRAAADPTALTALVRREVRAVEPTAAVEHATTMEEIRKGSMAPRTFAMRLLFAFSVVATGLALVGIYGVLSLSVGSRIKEIAVRKAIGAQQFEILRSVSGEGGRLILIGLALGVIVAFLVGRALEAQLFQVRAADPLSLGAAALVFGTVALCTCVLPAIRAARIDLLSALHHE